MELVPLQAVADQTFLITIGTPLITQYQLTVYQKTTGMFIDLYNTNTSTDIIVGTLCRNLSPLVISRYLNFPGDLIFVDSLGLNADPVYTGLGTRWFLVYLEPSDYTTFNLDPVFD